MKSRMEESNKKDGELPRLTLTNFNSHFRDEFRIVSLSYGDCAEIIMQGVNKIIQEPHEDDLDPIRHTVRPDGTKENMLKYSGENGYRRFEKDEKLYYKFIENKKKLISKLMMAMDHDVRTLVTTKPTFTKLMNDYDLHGIWNLVQEVCIGKGNVSA